MNGSGVSESGKIHLARSPGRPINTSDSARPKRTRSTPKAKVCVFSSCSFCPNDTAGSLHRAFSDGIGESLIEIKLKTQDDHMITCVSELEGAGDASKSTIIGHVCGQLSEPSRQYFIVMSR